MGYQQPGAHAFQGRAEGVPSFAVRGVRHLGEFDALRTSVCSPSNTCRKRGASSVALSRRAMLNSRNLHQRDPPGYDDVSSSMPSAAGGVTNETRIGN